MDSKANKGSKEVSDQKPEDPLDKAEGLIWSLLDDDIEMDELQELEVMMKEDEAVVELYVQCVQMHTDLQGHFIPLPEDPSKSETPKSPILGMLGSLRPGSDTFPPVPPTSE